jgi:RNA polymerase II elongation factor ELL
MGRETEKEKEKERYRERSEKDRERERERERERAAITQESTIVRTWPHDQATPWLQRENRAVPPCTAVSPHQSRSTPHCSKLREKSRCVECVRFQECV